MIKEIINKDQTCNNQTDQIDKTDLTSNSHTVKVNRTSKIDNGYKNRSLPRGEQTYRIHKQKNLEQKNQKRITLKHKFQRVEKNKK